MFTIKKCAQCGKTIGRLEIAFTCNSCGRTICNRCIKKVSYSSGDVKKYYDMNHKRPEFSWTKMSNVFCPSCARQFRNNQQNMKRALERSDSVEIVSRNYRGRKNSGTVIRQVSTDWFRDKNDCYEDLRKMTSVVGGRKAINTTLYTRTSEEPSNTSKHGVHKYTEYQLKADIVK